MAISLIAHTALGSPDSGAITTSAIDATGANFVVIVIGSDEATAGNYVLSDSSGNTYSLLTDRGPDSGGGTCIIAYVANATVSSSFTVTVASTAGVFYPSVAVACFSGVKTTSPFGTENGGTSGSNTTFQAGSVTPAGAGDLVIAGIEPGTTPGTMSIDSSFSITDSISFSGGNHYPVSLAYLVSPAGAAVNPTWTSTASTTASIAIATFAAPAGGPDTLSVSDSSTTSESLTIIAVDRPSISDSSTTSESLTLKVITTASVSDSTSATVEFVFISASLLKSAISLVAHTKLGSPDGGGITTGAINATGANFVVLVIASDTLATGDFLLSDSSSNTYSLTTLHGPDGGGGTCIIAYVANASVSSSFTVTVLNTGGVFYPSVAVAAFSGVRTTSPFGTENGGTSASATTFQAGSVTPASVGDLVIAGIEPGTSPGTMSIDSGFSITDSTDFSGGNHYPSSLAYLVSPGGAAVNPTWTSTAGTTASITIATFAGALAITVIDTSIASESVTLSPLKALFSISDANNATGENVTFLVLDFLSISDSTAATTENISRLVTANQLVSDATAATQESVSILFQNPSFLASDFPVTSESVSLAVQPASLSTSDSSTVSESITAAPTASPSVFDSSTSAESVNIAQTWMESTSDSSTSAENVSAVELTNSSVSDSSTSAESVSAQTSAIIESAGDSATSAESVQLSAPELVVVSDASTTSDSLGTAAITSSVVSDSSSTSESFSPLSLDFISISDNSSISELVTDVLLTNLSVNDSSATSDLFNTSSQQPQLFVLDSSTTSESIAFLFLADLVSVEDDSSTSESIAISLPLIISLSDASSTADFLNTGTATFLSLFDISSTSESVVLSPGAVPLSVFDSISTSESITISIANLPLAVSDTSSTSEFLFQQTATFTFATGDDSITSESSTVIYSMSVGFGAFDIVSTIEVFTPVMLPTPALTTEVITSAEALSFHFPPLPDFNLSIFDSAVSADTAYEFALQAPIITPNTRAVIMPPLKLYK